VTDLLNAIQGPRATVALLAVLAVLAIGYLATSFAHDEKCEGYWEASSVQYVNGVAQKSIVTHGCGHPQP